MIKAELDFGDRDRAHALMDRLDARYVRTPIPCAKTISDFPFREYRMFPVAVTSRVRALFAETVESPSPPTSLST
jgi:hypothetical protein